MYVYRISCNCFILIVILKNSVLFNDFILVFFYVDFCMFRGLNFFSIVMLMNLKRFRLVLKIVIIVVLC